jgi:hypothetical protein
VEEVGFCKEGSILSTLVLNLLLLPPLRSRLPVVTQEGAARECPPLGQARLCSSR